MIQSHGFGSSLHERLLYSFRISKPKLVRTTSDALLPQILLEASRFPPDAVNHPQKSEDGEDHKTIRHRYPNRPFHFHP